MPANAFSATPVKVARPRSTVAVAIAPNPFEPTKPILSTASVGVPSAL